MAGLEMRVLGTDTPGIEATKRSTFGYRLLVVLRTGSTCLGSTSG